MTERKTRHESTTPRLSRDSLHLAKEVRSIQRRAAEHDRRIVTIGPLVFFSTDTGDAWMLEPADQLAAGGDPLPVHIEETKPATPSAGKDATESRVRCSSTKTPARTVSPPSKATRYSDSFALSTKRIATSCNGAAFKFQICLARTYAKRIGTDGFLSSRRRKSS